MMSIHGKSERFCEMKELGGGVGRREKRECNKESKKTQKKPKSKYTQIRITSCACCIAIEWRELYKRTTHTIQRAT